MTQTSDPTFRIEPLGETHDRRGFHSGVPELDRYLHEIARQDVRRKIAAVFVLVDNTGFIHGYYTLSAYGVRVDELPAAAARKLPRYPLLPATMLGRLAVASASQGKNFGRVLLVDALRRSWRNTSEVGSMAVVVEALDERARKFYLHHQFDPFPNQPDKLFITMATIADLLK